MGPGRAILLLIGVLLFFAMVFAFLEGFVGQDLGGNLVVEEGSIDVYFCPVEDCERVLLDEIGKSTDISCAFYDLGLETVSELLIQKQADVFVYEEHKDFREIPSKGLMHHKFCVLDSEKVITGSMNPTVNGAKFNDNNLLVIESETVAYRYLSEFKQINERKTEEYSKRRVAPRYINISGSLVQLLFCPQERCEQTVLGELEKAKQSVYFMTFSFTSDEIGTTLLELSESGIHVEGVFESRMNPEHSEFGKLERFSVKDGNPKTMHHKVFIIDNRTVITGSYNPTWSATTRNDENMLIIDDYLLAEKYVEEYLRVKSES